MLRLKKPIIKGHFSGTPILRISQNGRDYILLGHYKRGMAHKDFYFIYMGKQYVARSGLVTNGVSSPRLIWRLLPPWGTPLSFAAIIHDQLCEDLPTVPFKLFEYMAERDKADKLLRIMMISLDYNVIYSYVVYFFVSIYSHLLAILLLCKKSLKKINGLLSII